MGGSGGKYSKRKYLRAINKLARKHPDKFKIKEATKELYQIEWLGGDERRPYPLAANHGGISSGVADALGKLFEKHGICTKEEFLQMIR